MLLWLAFGLGFGSAALGGVAGYLPLSERMTVSLHRRTAAASSQLSEMFLTLPPRTVWLLYAFSPALVGVLAWLATGKVLAGCVGAVAGVALPKLILAQARRTYVKRFHGQLVDALLLLSSSLKAGLSMAQAFTVVVEEMPPPIAQEFGLVLKEIRMGVNLDEAMAHLKRRLPLDDLTLFITAVLVARETGGDITHVFRRLVETMRERKKLKERIKTLTFMARLQGIIMALLPVAFGFLVYQMDHQYFQFFFTDPMGRVMLAGVILLQCMGGLLFLRFSRSPL